jgi:uncharacterized protein YbjT (DUF2867 family)
VARGSGVGARRHHLHRRHVQDCREDDLRQGRRVGRPLRPVQLQGLAGAGRWPVLLTPLDTTGEKPFEAFVGDGETEVGVGLRAISALAHRPTRAGDLGLFERLAALIDNPTRRSTRRRSSRQSRKPSPASATSTRAATSISGSDVVDIEWRTRAMKIVVIGGSGLIGTKLVSRLRQDGHEVVAASPNSGVNTITGEGLAEALAGAQVVVDVANSPSFEDRAVLEFFETSGRNLLAAEAAAGVRHHLALSVVGTDRLPDSGYLRAKIAQENLIKASGIPYTILRSTQFFEFIDSIIKSGADGDVIRLSPALLQPVASDDAVAVLADLTVGPPVNGTVEVAGPEPFPLDKLARKVLAASGDKRQVIADVHARYFGTELSDQSLTPGDHPRLGPTRLEDWLSHSLAQA